MRRKLVSFFVLTVIPAIVFAEIEVGGYILTDTRLFLQKNYKFYWNENRFDLKLKTSPLDDAKVYIELWGRNFGFPEVSTSSDLMRLEKDKVSPFLLRLFYQ